VLEIGCGTGAISRALVVHPGVAEVAELIRRRSSSRPAARVHRGNEARLHQRHLAGAAPSDDAPKAEARGRADADLFFGFIGFANFIARKAR
jgi:hypothetical protein